MKYALNIHCFTNTSGLSIPSSSYNVWHCTLDFMPFVTYLTENILIHFVYLFIYLVYGSSFFPCSFVVLCHPFWTLGYVCVCVGCYRYFWWEHFPMYIQHIVLSNVLWMGIHILHAQCARVSWAVHVYKSRTQANDSIENTKIPEEKELFTSHIFLEVLLCLWC